MEQREYNRTEKQSENMSVEGHHKDTEQRDKANQKLINALDQAWQHIDKNNCFLELEKSSEKSTFAMPELKKACELLDHEDSKRQQCWYNIIKISLVKSLYTKNDHPSFSACLIEYLQSQRLSTCDHEEQAEWLQEMFRLYNNNLKD